MKPVIREQDIVAAAARGMDQFVQLFADATLGACGGRLDADAMAELSAEQTTLLAYLILRDEVMDGGFVQLIHNGYGPFVFDNPLALMLRRWGLRDLSKLLYAARKAWHESGEEISRPCSDEEFMALFEKHPEYDSFDDEFVENEETWTEQVARHVDENIAEFAIVNEE